MATDMATLARHVAANSSDLNLRTQLLAAADKIIGLSILGRLPILGRAVSAGVGDFRSPVFVEIATHLSDVVRQWGAYAVNDPARTLSIEERLDLTLPFAADQHMSVRECAWMAFRPHLAGQFDKGLKLLEVVVRSGDANIRRFAVEVCRPRSVWGLHLGPLKRDPGQALGVLEPVRADDVRYVKLAVGNWLNDASKTRPEWVERVCSSWSATNNKHTNFIVKRGLRTLMRAAQNSKTSLFPDGNAAFNPSC